MMRDGVVELPSGLHFHFTWWRFSSARR